MTPTLDKRQELQNENVPGYLNADKVAEKLVRLQLERFQDYIDKGRTLEIQSANSE